MVPSTPKPSRVLFLVTGATLLIFGSLIAAITWQLRERLRGEVLRREAEAIHAVALMHLDPEEDPRLAEFGGAEFAIDDMFAAVLKSSRLRGVLAVQLFDAQGRLREAKPLAPDDVEKARWWGDMPPWPEARFLASGSWEDVSPLLGMQAAPGARLPLVDIAVPLTAQARGGVPIGVARYWVDGETVAREFSRIDRGLWIQAGIALFGGSVLVGAVLGWAFKRIEAANKRLLEQSVDLARANQELDFAAKTGALGAISAHLIHGLKNPLAGIEGFVFETVISSPDAMRGDACRQAIDTTRRLRALVSEITTVLREEADGDALYTIPVGEMLDAARSRALAAAEQAGINLTMEAVPGTWINARVANLSSLVIANLVNNAIEASPAGSTVAVRSRPVGEVLEFVISDGGPGIPASVRGELFRPVRSTKQGGGGVGLAISLRLARHAGGNLELVRSDATGSEFRLTVPASRRTVNAS